ncbi:bifunctional folylpolyglutamate synthase/dihydrofolate synthase [Lactobacillus xylocopicola]|uniref:tetrahydrofolate synthase n=1 Tax=Lactobacillus xylocopicola TaxID=2976676 RepID=A0ABN6SLU1_9LACO|nr:folylpolyglutamate synthase/dihydrofolate synthase family protein [Lactobacillus xylocopicola]BDR60384.1 bifunctional folylpolyglutamate synthase/dihydrofolate synthase [Lactobacillus xylocopicola]
MNFTSAQAVINHLYALPRLHPKADLSYINRVLQILGNPQNQVKTVHVTGTNGKGSTSYYLSNLLQKAGQKTGLFVSPYVFSFNERIQLNGERISDHDLVNVANQVEEAILQVQRQDPDFGLVIFEYEVVLAFVYFVQKKCDYAVIEVGIGGEHDKTNVITPEVSIITTIGLDHEEVIGPTIKEIAQEKSGVIKFQRPVVLGYIPAEALPIITHKAAAEAAPVKRLGLDFSLTWGRKILYSDKFHTVKLTSRPQVEEIDAALAICAFSLLHLPLSSGEVAAAINQTVIPGRYQIVQERPLVILDGAHNVQAMQSLLAFVRQEQVDRRGRLRILLTMMQDKDMEQVFALFNQTEEVELTTLDYQRAAKKADFPGWVQQKYPYQPDWQEAYREMRQASQTNDILLVTGSFYLVGNILQMEDKNAGTGK